MATPTPGKHAPAQVVATPPVSTPFSASNHHPAFSPHGPRSVVPSPQQVKKSPANSNTLYGYPSGGGHPTNSSFGVGYDSPSAAMALGGVPGLADLGLDGIGAPGIGTPLGVMGTPRADEDERKRKLQQVMDILKTNKGRLSEAGIERLTQSVGLEYLWETHMRSAGSMRTLAIAGSALSLDIDFSDNVVKGVMLSFLESPEIVTRHVKKAEDILLRDLQFAPNESPLTKMLDRFAANLERLAVLDKLSVIPGLNCYEAIAGIYESLERLHKWEVVRLKEQEDMADRDDGFLERMAKCTKSGMPLMHVRDRVGLSFDYWQEKRLIHPKERGNTDQKAWSLLVECAPSPALVYTPLRVSENWISAEIQKANPPAEDIFLTHHGPILDWLEPDNTLLPSTEAPKSDSMEGIEQTSTQKYPEVMFIARFDPPLIVPYGLAMQIYTSTSAPIDMYQTSTFDGLMFPHGPEEKVDPGEARIIRQQRTVPIFEKNGSSLTRIHKNTLFIEKIDYGRTLTELPFSHPRELVEMLPHLRQYAFLSTILGKSFGPSKDAPEHEKKIPKNKRDEFSDFLKQASKPEEAPLSMDISFSTQPVPRLQLVFPFKNRTANVTFEIKINGGVEIVSQNVLTGKERMLTTADLGRMLETTEDLGIWAEFVRRRLG